MSEPRFRLARGGNHIQGGFNRGAQAQPRARSRSRPRPRQQEPAVNYAPAAGGRVRFGNRDRDDDARQIFDNLSNHLQVRPVHNSEHQQERWIVIELQGEWKYHVNGAELDQERHVRTHEAERLIRYRTRQEFLQRAKIAIREFMNQAANLNDGYWTVGWRRATVSDSLAREQLMEEAEPEDQIGMRSAKPMVNKYLKGADANQMSEADFLEFINCAIMYFIKAYMARIPTLDPKRGGVDLCCEIMEVTRKEVIKNGVTIHQFKKLCDNWKISLLALNHYHKLVIPRTVYKSSPYSCAMVFVFDGHCYPILDKGVRKQLSQTYASVSDEKVTTKTVNKEKSKGQEEAKSDEKNMFKSTKEYIDLPVEALDQVEDCVVYYDRKNLKTLLVELLEKKNTLYKHHHTKGDVTRIQFDDGVLLLANPNHRSKMTWKDSKYACDKLAVPFQNQSISAVGYEHMNMFFHPNGSAAAREHIPDSMRKQIIQEQKRKCDSCQKMFAEGQKIEIHHVIPVSGGGLTIRENLVALHKECHDQISAQQAGERLFRIDNSMSYYNNTSFGIFTCIKNGLVHNYISPGQYTKAEKDGKLVAGIDLRKCRRNMLRYANVDEWCCFSVLDYPVKFDPEIHSKGILKTGRGFYFIESKNICPLRGNGWYSLPMVRFCLQKGLIKLDQIKFVILASLKLDPQYFHKWIDHLVKVFDKPEEEKMLKLMINGTIGIFGSKNTHHKEMRFFKVEKAANAEVMKRKEGEDTVFTVVPRRFHEKDEVLDDKGMVQADFFEVSWNTRTTRLENHLPLFYQILDLEAIELWKASRLVCKAGGRMAHINTDSAVGLFDNQQQVDALYRMADEVEWAPGVPKYSHVSKIAPHMYERVEEANDKKYELKESVYKVVKDPMHDDFKKHAKKLLETYNGGLLTSPPGCGKTHLTREMIKEIRKRGEKVLIMAPTHQARQLLDEEAQTVHSALSSLKYGQGFQRFAKYDHIICDEISMVSEPMHLAMIRIKQKCPKVSVWYIGDPEQLPPVQDRVGANFDYVGSPAIHWLCNGVHVTLSKNRRGMVANERGELVPTKSSQKLFDMYMNPSTVDTNDFPYEQCRRSICYTNSKRKAVNEYWMEKDAEKASKSLTLAKPATGHKRHQDIILTKGMWLVAMKTRGKYSICNADRLKVMGWDKKTVSLCHMDENNVIKKDVLIIIPLVELTSLTVPGWCTTLHRAQGQTIREPFTIYQWEKFDNCMKYVALSRASKLKYINILDDPDERDEDYRVKQPNTLELADGSEVDLLEDNIDDWDDKEEEDPDEPIAPPKKETLKVLVKACKCKKECSCTDMEWDSIEYLVPAQKVLKPAKKDEVNSEISKRMDQWVKSKKLDERDL